MLLVALLVSVVAILVIVRLWDAIWHAPRRMMRARTERRRAAGYRALSKGMVAVAAGDAAEARRQARTAHGMLGEPPLTLLLAAQAAQLNGDEMAAQKYFTAMLDRPEMRFLGLRGLLNQALARGDHEAALDYARRAQQERPDATWPAEALIGMQVRLGQWSDAAGTINQAVGQKHIQKPTARRQLAALFLEEARELATSDPTRALELTRSALKRRPDLVPAIALEASLLQKLGRGRDARKLIEQAWAGSQPGPHPLLAASYAALEPDEQPLERARRFETLAAKAPQNRESRLAVAETAMAAGLWATGTPGDRAGRARGRTHRHAECARLPSDGVARRRRARRMCSASLAWYRRARSTRSGLGLQCVWDVVRIGMRAVRNAMRSIASNGGDDLAAAACDRSMAPETARVRRRRGCPDAGASYRRPLPHRRDAARA